MTDIAKLGFDVDSGPLQRGSSALTGFSKSAQQAAKQTGLANMQFQAMSTKTAPKFGSALSGMQSRLGGVGRNAGQAGIQIQQFVGQVAAGQSPMLALSQQAADLGIVLGAPLIGVLVSLGATLGGAVVAAFSGAEESAESLSDRIADLTDDFENLTAAQRQYVMMSLKEEMAETRSGMEDTSESIDKVSKSLRENMEIVRSMQSGGMSFSPTAGRNVEEEQKELVRLNALFDTQTQELFALQDRYDEVLEVRTQSRDEIESEREALDDLISSLEEEAGAIGKSARELAIREAQSLNADPKEIARIERAYDRIEAHEAETEALKQQEAEYRRYLKAVSATATAEERLRESRDASITSQLQAIDRQIGATIESLKTEEQLADEWYQESLNNLMAANEQELSIIGGFNAAKLALEEQYQARKLEIAGDTEPEYTALQNESLQAYASATSAALGLFKQFADNRIADEQRALNATENATEEEIAARNKAAKKAFEDGKNLQLAMVGVNTAAAIMNELATNPNPFAKWASVAAIALTGATQASAISSSTFGGLSTPTAPSAPASEPGGPMGGGGTQNIVTVNFTGATSKDDIANAMRELFEDDFIAFDSDSAQNQVVVNG